MGVVNSGQPIHNSQLEWKQHWNWHTLHLTQGEDSICEANSKLHFDFTFLCGNRTLLSVVVVERMHLNHLFVTASGSIAGAHATVSEERCWGPGRRSTTWKVLPNDTQNTKPEVPIKHLSHEASHCLLKRGSQATWPKNVLNTLTWCSERCELQWDLSLAQCSLAI